MRLENLLIGIPAVMLVALLVSLPYFREKSQEAHRLMSECILENKGIPNPKEYCQAKRYLERDKSE